MRKTTLTLLIVAALAALPAVANAASGSFTRVGGTPYNAAPFSLEVGALSGLATVRYNVQASIPQNETGTFSTHVCGNGDFSGPADSDGLPTCTGFSDERSVSQNGEFNGTLTIEHNLPAGDYVARGVASGGGSRTVTDLEPFEVIDQCRFRVTAAAGIKAGSLWSARPGDHMSCRMGSEFETGELAPLAQVLAVRSDVDRTAVRMEGPGIASLTPVPLGEAKPQMALTIIDDGELRLDTDRRLAKTWNTTTDSAVIGQQSGRSTAYIVETSNKGNKTVVRNRAGVNTITTLGHGGLESIPLGLVDRASCIKLRKWTRTLRRRQSVVVRKGRPPQGGPAEARRACRR